MEFALRHFVEIYEDFLYYVAQPGDWEGPFLVECSPEPFNREERIELLERTPSEIRSEQWEKYLRDRGPFLLGVVRQLQVETVPLRVREALLRVIELDAWEAARLEDLDLFVENLDEPMFHGTLGFLAEDWSAWLEPDASSGHSARDIENRESGGLIATDLDCADPPLVSDNEQVEAYAKAAASGSSLNEAPSRDRSGLSKGESASESPDVDEETPQADAIAEPSQSALPIGPLDKACRVFRWREGRIFHFSPIRAACVRVLLEANSKKSQSYLHQDQVLAEAGSDSSRLRDVFRRDPAWGTLIVSGPSRGVYRLDLDEKG